jgi:hypothetical protein
MVRYHTICLSGSRNFALTILTQCIPQFSGKPPVAHRADSVAHLASRLPVARRAFRRAANIPSRTEHPVSLSRAEHSIARRISHRAPSIPSHARYPVSLSRAEHSITRRTSHRAPRIPSHAKHPIAPNISSHAVRLAMGRAFVVLSLRQYDARDHIAQFCCAIRSRGQSCALVSCARQGASYSGGRLGIAAAVDWVARGHTF